MASRPRDPAVLSRGRDIQILNQPQTTCTCTCIDDSPALIGKQSSPAKSPQYNNSLESNKQKEERKQTPKEGEDLKWLSMRETLRRYLDKIGVIELELEKLDLRKDIPEPKTIRQRAKKLAAESSLAACNTYMKTSSTWDSNAQDDVDSRKCPAGDTKHRHPSGITETKTQQDSGTNISSSGHIQSSGQQSGEKPSEKWRNLLLKQENAPNTPIPAICE